MPTTWPPCPPSARSAFCRWYVDALLLDGLGVRSPLWLPSLCNNHGSGTPLEDNCLLPRGSVGLFAQLP